MKLFHSTDGRLLKPLNMGEIMKKLILIILIAFSFSTDKSDWWKGKNNPNGQTLAITYAPSEFWLFGDNGNDIKSHYIQIPITDFFTITQTRWKVGGTNMQISFHIPVNWK